MAAEQQDLETILSCTLDALHGVVPFTGGVIAVVEGDDLMVRAAHGPFAAQVIGQRIPSGRSRLPDRVWRVVTTGKPFISGDVLAEGFSPSIAIRSCMVLPLCWRSRCTGVFSLDSTEPHAFTDADARIAEDVALALAGPVELARVSAAARQELELRRLAETAIRESEARFYRLAQNAPDIIFHLTLFPERRVSFVNAAVTRILGYTPEEFYARPDLAETLLHPEDLERVRAGTDQPIRAFHKEGQIVWLECYIARIPGAGGPEAPPASVEVVARDVTRRIEAEQRARAARAEVEEQAADLARLNERERLAMDLHDGAIQSLFSVMLQVETHARRAADEEARAACRAVGAQVQAVIDELRLHLVAGGTRAALVDTSEMLGQMVAALALSSQSMSGPAVVFQSHAAGHRMPAGCAADLFYVAREAISNAVRHSGARRVTVRLCADARSLVLAILDDGRGVSRADASAAETGPAIQLAGDHGQDPGEGHGHGLLNMRRRSLRLGGTLTVRRRATGGTAIRLCVPLAASGAY